MTAKRILVLGGSGFTGRRLVAGLYAQGYGVEVISRRPTEDFAAFNTVNCHQGDLSNQDLIDSLLPQCDTVFYLAWHSTPGSSAGEPLIESEYNLQPALNFLGHLRAWPQVKLIYLSSGGAVYGNPAQIPVTESTHLQPLSYYGAAKAAMEHFLHAFCRQHGHAVTVLRPSNFYGPGQIMRPGFGIVATLFQHIANNTPLPVWGDGSVVRDYLFMDDFIELLLLLLRYPMPVGLSVYNVGAGKGYSLNQLCNLAEQVSGKPLQRHYHPARSVDVQRIVLDCSKLEKVYGWRAQTDLPQGLQQTWQWFQSGIKQ